MFSRFIAWSIIVPVSIAFASVAAFAVPAVHPPASAIFWPLACPGGEVTVESENFSYKPGQSGVARTIWCQPSDGSPRQDVTMKTLGLGFLAYLILSVLLLRYALLPWIRRRLTGAIEAAPEALGAARASAGSFVDDIVAQARAAGANVTIRNFGEPGPSADAADRLAVLEGLLDQGLISPEDYEAKKAQILSQL
jgi:hypothetical protein